MDATFFLKPSHYIWAHDHKKLPSFMILCSFIEINLCLCFFIWMRKCEMAPLWMVFEVWVCTFLIKFLLNWFWSLFCCEGQCRNFPYFFIALPSLFPNHQLIPYIYQRLFPKTHFLLLPFFRIISLPFRICFPSFWTPYQNKTPLYFSSSSTYISIFT